MPAKERNNRYLHSLVCHDDDDGISEMNRTKDREHNGEGDCRLIYLQRKISSEWKTVIKEEWTKEEERKKKRKGQKKAINGLRSGLPSWWDGAGRGCRGAESSGEGTVRVGELYRCWFQPSCLAI